MDLARAAGTSTNSDFTALKEHLSQFAENGQLSIFSGNWFDAEDGTGFKLPPELDLICTAHYLEALGMQAKASQISALLGGKMPHVMTLRPGGTAFVPTDQKLDDLKALVDELYTWIEATMIPDVLAIAPRTTPMPCSGARGRAATSPGACSSAKTSRWRTATCPPACRPETSITDPG